MHHSPIILHVSPRAVAVGDGLLCLDQLSGRPPESRDRVAASGVIHTQTVAQNPEVGHLTHQTLHQENFHVD